jgi:hypothetical protein
VDRTSDSCDPVHVSGPQRQIAHDPLDHGLASADKPFHRCVHPEHGSGARDRKHGKRRVRKPLVRRPPRDLLEPPKVVGRPDAADGQAKMPLRDHDILAGRNAGVRAGAKTMENGRDGVNLRPQDRGERNTRLLAESRARGGVLMSDPAIGTRDEGRRRVMLDEVVYDGQTPTPGVRHPGRADPSGKCKGK